MEDVTYAVQLALGNAPYAPVIAAILANTRTCNIEWVDRPDPPKCGVLVVNEKTLDDLWEPIERPERIVLVTPNEARHLERAWNAGIRSLVFDSDPPRIIALAVLAVALRESRPNTPHNRILSVPGNASCQLVVADRSIFKPAHLAGFHTGIRLAAPGCH